MKKIVYLLILIFVTKIAFANDEQQKQLSRSKLVQAKENITVNQYSDPNKTIVLSKQEPTFKLILKANPTTGYSWFIQSYDSRLLELVKQEYIPSKSNLIGAGGYEEWTFQAKPAALLAPSLMNISMIYARPWQIAQGQLQVYHVVTH